MQLVNAQTAETLLAQGVAVLDASWCMPGQSPDGRARYEAGHIPNAYFFDIDAVADHSTDYPHMMPSGAQLAEALGAMGIERETPILVYDQNHGFASARVAWMLSAFAHPKVFMLDGGFAAWQAADGAVDQAQPDAQAVEYPSDIAALGVASLAAMRSIVADGTMQVLDARPLPRFNGQVAEPRAGLRSGHMPGAVCLPFNQLLDQGRFKAREALAEVFAEAGVDLNAPIVTTCGSGVSAALINVALSELGVHAQLYDGSWSQWAALDDTPVIAKVD